MIDKELVLTVQLYLIDNDGGNLVKVGYTQLKRNHKDEIHAAQQFIQLDPDLQHIRGLHNPIFGQSLRFDVVHEEMVQILHSSGNHCVTVSTIGSTSPLRVRVYDSLGKALPLIQRSKLQLFSILQTRK